MIDEGKPNRDVYLCSAVKDGKVTDITFTDNGYDTALFERECRRHGSVPEYIKMNTESSIVERKARERPSNCGRKPLRLKCIETGEEYKNVRALHRWLLNHGHTYARWTLDRRLSAHKPINGLHYEFL